MKIWYTIVFVALGAILAWRFEETLEWLREDLSSFFLWGLLGLLLAVLLFAVAYRREKLKYEIRNEFEKELKEAIKDIEGEMRSTRKELREEIKEEAERTKYALTVEMDKIKDPSAHSLSGWIK